MRIGIRRHTIFIGVQLISRVIRRDAHVIFLPRLQDACAELIKPGIILRGFDLIDELSSGKRHNIGFSCSVLTYLENIYVEGNIAIGHVEYEVDESRLLLMKGEPEPLESFKHCRIAVFTLRWSIGPLIVATINGLPHFKWLRVFPSAVRRSGNHSTKQTRVQLRSLQNFIQ